MQIYKTKRKMAAWINVDICCSIASEQHDPLASFYYFLVVEYHALIELRGRECPPTPPLGNSNLLILDYKVTKNGFRITHPMSYLSLRPPIPRNIFWICAWVLSHQWKWCFEKADQMFSRAREIEIAVDKMTLWY